MWRPVRYGESCEAWRSFEVMVCQNDWKKEPTLAAVSIGGAKTAALCRCMSYDCAMVSVVERERKKRFGCALRCGVAKKESSRERGM